MPDIYADAPQVSPYDRTIVIDTQPLFSASVLASLIESLPPGSGGGVSVAGASSAILADIAGT